MTDLQCQPWTSVIEESFLATLGQEKLDKDQLDDSAKKILGMYEIRPGIDSTQSASMLVKNNAFTADHVPKDFYRGEGCIKNFNTYEDFKTADRSSYAEIAARTIWNRIQDESIYASPSLLSSFYCISYADLKKFRFWTHFFFPALHGNADYQVHNNSKLQKEDTEPLVEAVQSWKCTVDSRLHGFFLAKRYRAIDSTKWTVASLDAFKQGFFDGVTKEDQFVSFADPSTHRGGPGWMLRNYLVLIRQLWQLDEVQILCYRDTHNLRHESHSIVLHILSKTPGLKRSIEMPKATGWERDQNRNTARMTDLAALMDPVELADQAISLNLQLSKWRQAPSLNLDVVKNTSCLILGAGTLGSYAARNLMGWAVRKITFVDNGSVSYSNPVRQPLYRLEDCVNGGVKKATRAAEALKEIYPNVDVRGEVMDIPMLGHPVDDLEKSKRNYEKLKKLIQEHDVVFILLDTREGRWLPTLMAKSAGKIALNAALGFHSLVVMRHGLRPTKLNHVEHGCYFCNEINAPTDSLKDATLDQQCTVTRPGVAPIASALLVELMVSILQHPDQAHAPAPPVGSNANLGSQTTQDDFEHPLGEVPQQVRMFLNNFSLKKVVCQAFENCSACGKHIVNAYEKHGWEFVKRALEKKGYVEEESGLKELQDKAEAALEAAGWDEDGDVFEDGDDDDNNNNEGVDDEDRINQDKPNPKDETD